jgi:hypothetical protein
MSNVIVLAITITMCMSGPIATSNTCEDGSAPFTANMNIMSGTSPDNCVYNWENIRTCVSQWDSIIEITKDNKILFKLSPDGKIEHSDDFKIDQASLIFYKTVAKLINDNVLTK